MLINGVGFDGIIQSIDEQGNEVTLMHRLNCEHPEIVYIRLDIIISVAARIA
jgi:hypothetical protein